MRGSGRTLGSVAGIAVALLMISSSLILVPSSHAASFAAVPVRPAVAPAIVVSPASGLDGNLVGVNGSGFSPGQSVRLLLSNASLPSYSVAESYGVIVAGDGTFSFSDFRIPSLSPGAYLFNASDSVEFALATYQVTSSRMGLSLLVSPTSGVPADPLTVSGSGFYPMDYVTVYLGNATGYTYLGSAMADVSGAFTLDTYVPAVSPGADTVFAIGETIGIAFGSLTVEASSVVLSLTRASGEPGVSLEVWGYGFEAYESYTVLFGATGVGCDLVASSLGGIDCFLVVPWTDPGPVTITVDNSYAIPVVTASFEVYPVPTSVFPAYLLNVSRTVSGPRIVNPYTIDGLSGFLLNSWSYCEVGPCPHELTVSLNATPATPVLGLAAVQAQGAHVNLALRAYYLVPDGPLQTVSARGTLYFSTCVIANFTLHGSAGSPSTVSMVFSCHTVTSYQGPVVVPFPTIVYPATLLNCSLIATLAGFPVEIGGRWWGSLVTSFELLLSNGVLNATVEASIMNAYLNWGGTSSQARTVFLWQFASEFVVGGPTFGFELSHTVLRQLVESANVGSGISVAVSMAFESWSEHTAPGKSLY